MSVNLSDLEKRVLVNIVLSENAVHVVNEVTVINSAVGFFVDRHQSVKFSRVQGHCALHHQTLELVLGHGAFAQIVEVQNELFQTNLFHHNLGLHFLLDILDSLSVITDWFAGLFHVDGRVFAGHGQVLECVVNGVAELDIVDFTAVRREMGKQDFHGLRLHLHIELLKHSVELVDSNFRAFGAVKVLKTGLQLDPASLDFLSEVF